MNQKGCYFSENSMNPQCHALWHRAEEAEARVKELEAILQAIEEDGTEEHNAAVRLRQKIATWTITWEEEKKLRREAEAKATRVQKFLTAYITQSAMTFADPATGKLVSATPEVIAFALAVTNGPMTTPSEES